ncbi:MAG: alpha/beta fold hydrolase [Alphaproteobacteria bacterium]|nr:alpha/beta fold hydrolase [Alphaproteobacteria bacterium]
MSKWLQPLRAKIPADLNAQEQKALADAIQKEALKRADLFLAGLRSYQASSFKREDATDMACLWSAGSARLLDYAPDTDAPVVFIVPSLVNGYEILDMAKTQSFVRFLAAQGFRPLVMDWGVPAEAEKDFTLDDYLRHYLKSAWQKACTVAGARKCHMVGYCMGGVMAMALAQHVQKNKLASLTLIATPWDFGAQGVAGVPAADTQGGISFLTQARQWMTALEQYGFLPPQLLQFVFTTFQIRHILDKYQKFGQATMDEDSMRRFVLTEDWLNRGIPLTLPVARECLEGWYQRNDLFEGRFRALDAVLDPKTLTVPTYILMARDDNIVPRACAAPLTALIKNTKTQEAQTGHIGLMIGHKAPTQIWPSYARWLKAA